MSDCVISDVIGIFLVAINVKYVEGVQDTDYRCVGACLESNCGEHVQ